MNPTHSPAERFVARLAGAGLGPEGSHELLTMLVAKLTPAERCYLQFNWRGFWARPKQIIPYGPWRSYGLKTGRGFGKTRAVAEYVDDEIRAGRAGRVALCAETEDKTVDVMITGQSGLLNIARPWFRPKWEPGNGRIVYPNGAQCFVYYATEPEKFRGPEHHLFWGDELGSWASNTASECWSNMHMGLRLGYGKLVWSSTPRSTPLMHKLRARSKKRPDVHVIVTGSTLENRGNLPAHVIEEWLEEYGGTRIGKRELEGEDLDDNPGALFSQEKITLNRRRLPDTLVRQVVAVDPAISTRKGNDMTGIVVAGIGTDGQVYIMADLSGQYPPERWGRLVLDAYRRYACDLIVYEENRGGNLVLSNLRALDHTMPNDRFKGVYARQGKELRAEPVATLYEKDRVSHVVGADLAELEKQMLEWDPVATPQSPDRIDAMVHAVVELAKLGPKDQHYEDYTSTSIAPEERRNAITRDDDYEWLCPDDDERRSKW